MASHKYSSSVLADPVPLKPSLVLAGAQQRPRLQSDSQQVADPGAAVAG